MIIISILIATIYAVINFCLGFVLLKYFFRDKFRDIPALAVLASGFLLGQGILSILWMILGLAGFFKLLVILPVLLLIVILSFSAISELKDLFFFLIKSFWSQIRQLSIIWKIIFSLTLITILLFGLGALLLPPTGDAESFYMVIPKIMAGTGRFLPQPNYYEFSKIGFFGEMHYAALMVLNNFVAAKFFVWFNALCVAVLLIVIGNDFKLKTTSKILLLIMLFSSSTFINYIADGKVDIFAAALGLAGYYWATQIRDKNWFASALAGLFLGLAIVAKLSYALVIPLGFAIIIIWNLFLDAKNQELKFLGAVKKGLISTAIIILFTVIVYLPQVIKNKVVYGDPWASRYSLTQSQPWLDSFWSHPTDEGEDNPLAVVNQPALKTESTPVLIPAKTPVKKTVKTITPPQQIKDWPATSRLIFLILTSPLAFTVWTYPGKGGNLSILVLSFLPLLFFWRPTNYLQKQIITMTLAGIFLWIIVRSTGVTPRYILPTLLLLLPLMAAAGQKVLEQRKTLLQFIIVASLIFVLASGLFIQLFVFQKFRSNVCALKPKTFYGPNCNSLNFLNQKALDSDRVFLVGYNGFYLKPSLLVNLDNNQEKLQFLFLHQDQPWEYLFNHGFKYVVIQKEVNFRVMLQLENDPQPDWLNIQRIYSDKTADIFSIEKK